MRSNLVLLLALKLLIQNFVLAVILGFIIVPIMVAPHVLRIQQKILIHGLDVYVIQITGTWETGEIDH